jgi:hypothetical protein
MYLEDGVCAQCGKSLDPSARFAPHNTVLDHVELRFRPLFCSPDHMQKMLEEYSSDALAEEEANLTKKHTDLFWQQYAAIGKSFKPKFDDIERQYNQRTGDNQERILALISLGLTERVAEQIKNIEDDRHEASTIRTKAFRALCAQEEQAKDQLERDRDRTLSRVSTEARQVLNKPEVLAQSCQRFLKTYADAKQRVLDSVPPPPGPAEITDQHRFEHTHILGPQGSGKTTLIQELILRDLSQNNPPAIVVIDPKGFLVKSIARLKRIHDTKLSDRLIILDPTHNPAPPLNLFSYAGTPAAINYAINNFDYLFAQAGVELTDRMRPIFRHCARVLFSIPRADLFLFMDFLESEPNDPRFQPHVDKLTDDGARRFFSKDFYGQSYAKTRQSVKERFDQIVSLDPRLRAAFSSPSPSLDFSNVLAQRKIVLVNTGFADVGPDESKYIGRHVINLTLGAAFSRGRDGPPAFLYIDEFQDFVDEKSTPKQLRLAREYNLGMICAHQQMFCTELSDALRSSISSTTIKYCSKVLGKERSYMLHDLEPCAEEFLDQQVPNKKDQTVKFACVVKGEQPFSVTIKYPNIMPDMQMSESNYQLLLQENARRLHDQRHTHPRPSPEEPEDKVYPAKATVELDEPTVSQKPNGPDTVATAPPERRDPGEPSDKW